MTATLARDATAPRRARELLREHAAGLPAERMDTAVLLISELVTNAVVHGAGAISLAIDVDASRAWFAVCDEGGGAPAIRDDPGADGGWGLRLVDQLATSWGVEDGRTRIWFELTGV